MTDNSGEETGPGSGTAGQPQHAAPPWLVDFRTSAHRNGFYQSGDSFGVVFADRGDDNLVVSFDNLSSARDDNIAREPWGYGFVAKNGWSQLGVMTFEPGWFRDAALFDYLRGLADSGFFRRFRQVTMTGTSMGGYAACAFASLSPGCVVIAFSPQSTLKVSLVPWEERFASGRKADWSGPFADGAEESAAASQVFLVHDVNFEPDLRHVERFRHPNAIPLRARYAGHKSALFLRRAGLLSTVVTDAVERRLTPARFYATYRAGRSLPWFLNGVKARLQATDREHLLPRLARAAQSLRPPRVAEACPNVEVPAARPSPRAQAASATPQAEATARKPAQPARSRQPLPRGPLVPDPQPVADLYMSGPDLPPPIRAGNSPWSVYRSAEVTGGAAWRRPKD